MNHPAMMGSQEKKMMNSDVKQLRKCLSSLAARSVLLISKRQYTSCKRRALIIEDKFKSTYFCRCKQSYLEQAGDHVKSILAHFQVLR